MKAPPARQVLPAQPEKLVVLDRLALRVRPGALAPPGP